MALDFRFVRSRSRASAQLSAAASRTAPGAETADRCGALRGGPCIPPGNAGRSAGTAGAWPCGAIRRASGLRGGGRALRARSRYSASTSAVGRCVSATNTSSPSGSSYGTMVVSSVSMRLEALAEDRLHPPEVADQLLHRPFVGHAARRERRFVQPCRQPPHLGRLRPQALDQRQMHRVFVAVIVMMPCSLMAGHYRMCHRRSYDEAESP